MNDIFSYYTKYRTHINEYNTWSQGLKEGNKNTDGFFVDKNRLKQKAKAIYEPILILDKYEHEKAEDSETFFQTVNIEMMSLATAIAALPIAVTKLIPFCNKHSLTNISKALTNYKNATIKNIPLPKALTGISVILGGLFFASSIKKSMQSQLGLIRKAGFDATQQIVDNPNLYAVLTPEQEEKVQKIVNEDNSQKNVFVDKLKDKVSLSTTFQSVADFNSNKKVYEKQKKEYFDKINNTKYSKVDDSAKEDKILFENLIKNVEHDVLEPLRKVETISNITYSGMFTGGFLEYLISDKLVEVLGIKNKFLSAGLKFGVPLLTYLLLNKNISDIENKAILATKYKHLKKFTENPQDYNSSKEDKKKNLFGFLKELRKDMQDYDKFATKELPQIEKKLSVKKQLELTSEQKREAKRLQKNTSMVINNQRERLYEQSVGIKSISETILGPLDIVATAIGGIMGSRMAKHCSNKKLAGIMTGLGAVIAFIPAAIVEAKLTKQQKLAEKISVMLSLKDMQDVSKFAAEEDNKTFSTFSFDKDNKIFKDFL